MRIDKVHIESFKNLKDFTVDIDESQLTNVFIGKNGAGKSNFIEALVIIFRDLDFMTVTTDFSYQIDYLCNDTKIRIENDCDTKKRVYYIDGSKITQKAFYENWHQENGYLPTNVFAYYSGPSNRLEKYFNKHQKQFLKALLNGEDKALRPLFYARMIHSNFVLLAFFSFFDNESNNFLKEHMDIESVESILFVLKKPDWENKNPHKKSEFWGARGIVRSFLDELYKLSLAPIKETAVYEEGITDTRYEVTYLYLKDQQKLMQLAQNYGDNVEFFKYLESTYLSDLIKEIRIKIRKTDGTVITFNELSEGEQQLLTVLGLLKFTKSRESLFFLDEPDTHLNPGWKYDYLSLIRKVVGETGNSQIFISTHDPIVIGGLHKEAVTIFENIDHSPSTHQPEEDPQGMGVAGLLIKLFDLPTTLDKETQRQLDRKRQLTYTKERTKSEEEELLQLQNRLDQLGFSQTTRDPLYEKFIEKLFSRPEYQNKELSKADLSDMDSYMDKIIAEILEEENNDIH